MIISLKQKFNFILKNINIKKLNTNYKIFAFGRNVNGKITVRHRGKLLKKSYKTIDYYRSLLNIRCIICTFEYDSIRKTLLSLLSYSIGIFSYIISIEHTRIGMQIYTTFYEKIYIGCVTLLKNIKINAKINCIELRLFNGAQLSRASGTFSKIVKKTNFFTVIQLKSGKLQRINKWCLATIGIILNFNYYLFRYKKAGLLRLKGVRPHVRGVAMNPIDHPYGGGEGKKSKKTICMSPWGKLIKGKKTKKKKLNEV